MTCRLFDAKSVPEPMLTYCELDSWKQISVKFVFEFYHFHPRKCIWIYRLQNGSYFSCDIVVLQQYYIRISTIKIRRTSKYRLWIIEIISLTRVSIQYEYFSSQDSPVLIILVSHFYIESVDRWLYWFEFCKCTPCESFVNQTPAHS